MTTDDLQNAIGTYWNHNKCLVMPDLGLAIEQVTVRQLPAQALTYTN